MAIDSATKRFSILDFGIGGIPIPDGSFDQGDRQTFLDGYSGILYGTAVPVTPPSLNLDVSFAFTAALGIGIDLTVAESVAFSLAQSFTVRF